MHTIDSITEIRSSTLLIRFHEFRGTLNISEETNQFNDQYHRFSLQTFWRLKIDGKQLRSPIYSWIRSLKSRRPSLPWMHNHHHQGKEEVVRRTFFLYNSAIPPYDPLVFWMELDSSRLPTKRTSIDVCFFCVYKGWYQVWQYRLERPDEL